MTRLNRPLAGGSPVEYVFAKEQYGFRVLGTMSGLSTKPVPWLSRLLRFAF